MLTRILVSFAGAAVLVVSAYALSWTEYRKITLEAGKTERISLDDSVLNLTGDTSIVKKNYGNFVEILLPDSATRHLEVVREHLGRLVLLVEPKPALTVEKSAVSENRVQSELTRRTDSALPPLPLPSVATNVGTLPAAHAVIISEKEDERSELNNSSEEVTNNENPTAYPEPIAIPPKPLPLLTPPLKNFLEPEKSSTYEPSILLQSVPAETKTISTITVSNPPVRVSERAVPRGSTRQPDTSLFIEGTTKPGELQLFSLAEDLFNRGLYSQSIEQYEEFLKTYPRSTLRDLVSFRIGLAYERRGVWYEQESFKQRDLRRSAGANEAEAIDNAINDYDHATKQFRELVLESKNTDLIKDAQFHSAVSLHGILRSQFYKGGIPQDSPAVVVEYLRSFVGENDTSNMSNAKLGIAQYYRDLGDARMAARMDAKEIHEAYDRAVSEYVEIVNGFGNEPAVEEAIYDIARLYDRNLEMRRFVEAVKYYDELVSKFSGGRFSKESAERAKWIKENYL